MENDNCRAYKTELNPNNKQKSKFDRFCWVSMAVFNVGLREWQHAYDAGEKPSAYGLKKQFNGVKDDIFPWARSAPYAVTESAFSDLGSAYKNFFRRLKNGEEPGYPKHKKDKSSFNVRGLKVKRDRVRIQGVGWIRLKERDYIPTTDSGLKFGTYATISKRAGHWYISVLVYEPRPTLNDMHDHVVLGIDFGIKDLAVCSNGKVFPNPKPLRIAQRNLRTLNRELARRKRGSANYKKTVRKLQRAHKKVSDIRTHTLHEISSYVTTEVRPRAIVIEDLNVKGMVKNHNLAQAISDVGFGELRRQIEYKAGWYGIEVVLADRWYPSSKTCSRCGVIKKDLTLADRTFVCEDCGFEIDRDYNAALNLENLGYQHIKK